MFSLDEKHEIGILGGTFDPVHKGHIAIAEKALDRCRLDRILFLPAPYPPHKDRELTSFYHRTAMLEAALADRSRMAVSTMESERPSPSYTVDTLTELHRRYGGRHFHLIIGADMFMEITLWHRHRDIFHLADLIVAARPGIDHAAVAGQVNILPGSFTYDSEHQMWRRDDGFQITYLAETDHSVSSSRARELLGRGEASDGLLPEPVLEYIRRNHLYRGGDSTGS